MPPHSGPMAASIRCGSAVARADAALPGASGPQQAAVLQRVRCLGSTSGTPYLAATSAGSTGSVGRPRSAWWPGKCV